MGNKLKHVVTGALSTGLILSAFSAASAAPENLSNHWAGDQVKRWAATGNLSGYGDGSVKPNATISRAEFISLVNRSFGALGGGNVSTITNNTYNSGNLGVTKSFKDVPTTHWAYNDLTNAVNAGIISGYADNMLKPNAKVTRQEAAAILAKALRLTPGEAADVSRFRDSSKIASWSKGSVAAVVDQKIMNGYPDGTFLPEKLLTRAEAVVILDAASGYNLDDTDNITTPGGTGTSVTETTYSTDTKNTTTSTDTDDTDTAGTTDTDNVSTNDTTNTNSDHTKDSQPTTTTNSSDDADQTADAIAVPTVNKVEGGDTTITGTSKKGYTVSIYGNDMLQGSAVADQNGKFSITVPTVTEGAKLTAKAKDTNGKESKGVEVTVASSGNDD